MVGSAHISNDTYAFISFTFYACALICTTLYTYSKYASDLIAARRLIRQINDCRFIWTCTISCEHFYALYNIVQIRNWRIFSFSYQNWFHNVCLAVDLMGFNFNLIESNCFESIVCHYTTLLNPSTFLWNKIIGNRFNEQKLFSC